MDKEHQRIHERVVALRARLRIVGKLDLWDRTTDRWLRERWTNGGAESWAQLAELEKKYGPRER